MSYVSPNDRLDKVERIHVYMTISQHRNALNRNDDHVDVDRLNVKIRVLRARLELASALDALDLCPVYVPLQSDTQSGT